MPGNLPARAGIPADNAVDLVEHAGAAGHGRMEDAQGGIGHALALEQAEGAVVHRPAAIGDQHAGLVIAAGQRPDQRQGAKLSLFQRKVPSLPMVRSSSPIQLLMADGVRV